MQYEEICDQCEEWMQPYLDRELDDNERAEAEKHLEGCGYCRHERKARAYVSCIRSSASSREPTRRRATR